MGDSGLQEFYLTFGWSSHRLTEKNGTPVSVQQGDLKNAIQYWEGKVRCPIVAVTVQEWYLANYAPSRRMKQIIRTVMDSDPSAEELEIFQPANFKEWLQEGSKLLRDSDTRALTPPIEG